MHSAKGFSLMELLVVLIIAGILAALSIPNYTKTRERAVDKEAQTALSLVQAAERIYRLKARSYYPVSGLPSEDDIADINTDLNLNLAEEKWDYSIAGGSSTFTACADRSVGGAARSWSINQDASEASPSGGLCP